MTPATYTPPNLGDLTSQPAQYHKCGPGLSYSFEVVATPVTVITSEASESALQIKDFNALTKSGVATRTDYLVSVESLAPAEAVPKTAVIEVANESILSAPADGVCTGVASGETTIIARAADGEISAKRAPVTIATSASVTRLTTPVDGSLTKHCNDQMEALTAGRDRNSMDLWSVRNNATGAYEWNPNCWGAGLVNKTCMSPYNSRYGSGAAGCLITPRHVAFTHHVNYYPKVGDQIRYVTPSNVTETFTIDDLEIHPNSVNLYIGPWDIVIAKLDRDVPDSIKFAKALPSDPTAYFPSMLVTQDFVSQTALWDGPFPYLRACFTTHFKRLATAYLWVLNNYVKPAGVLFDPLAEQVLYKTETSGPSLTLYPPNPLGDSIVPGASGSPAFIVVNSELVLTSLWTTPSGGFPYYADATTINGMLDELGGGYNLTEVDLSGFPTY